MTVDSDSFFVTDPVTLAKTFVDTWVGERFWNDVAPSLVRLAVGLVLAITLGIGLGLLIGSFRWLRSLTEPVLEFLRAIPPPVLVPILMLLVGINNEMKVLVIVSDWLMPGVRGDEFLARVHGRHPHIVTVMLTGQADEAAIERARRDANLHACLHKPWREDDLMAVIASALG